MDITRNETSINAIYQAIKKDSYVPTNEDFKLIHFCYDPLAKYILKFHEEMTKILIENIFNISVENLQLGPTENVPRNIDLKQTINDVCFITKDYTTIIFEVQNLIGSDHLHTRIQCYGYQRILDQLLIKKNCSLLPICLCVLLKDGKDYPVLIEDGDYLFGSNPDYSLVHCKTIHLEVINRIVKEKGLHNSTTFECADQKKKEEFELKQIEFNQKQTEFDIKQTEFNQKQMEFIQQQEVYSQKEAELLNKESAILEKVNYINSILQNTQLTAEI